VADLIKELKRRNVFRVAMVYLALAWLVIQITDMAVPALNLPASLQSIVFYLGLIGLPFALVFAWAFELTPDGLQRSSNVPEQESIRQRTGRQLEHLVVILLLVAVATLLWDRLSEPAVDMPIQQEQVAPAATSPDITPIGKSIAVLPFVNMSDDKDYFADGLSEELLNLLAKIPDLKVAGRTSSFKFKGKNEDLRVIGDTLGVATVLEGSVRRSGDRLRITAQLINVEDGFHIWSDTYDRQMADVFTIQDEVAAAITTALKLTLAPQSHSAEATTNLEAYSLYLEALSLWNDGLGATQAIAKLEDAIRLDPAFSEAYMARAEFAFGVASYTPENYQKKMNLAHTYALEALAIDPDQPFIEALAVASRDQDYDWYDEIAAFDNAIEKLPHDVRPSSYQVWNMIEGGYLSEVMSLAQTAMAIDPLSSIVGPRYGQALAIAGNMEAAREQWQRDVVKGQEEAMYLYFTERLLANDSEGAIEVLTTFAQANDLDSNFARPFVLASESAADFDAYLSQQDSLDTRLVALAEYGHRRLERFYRTFIVLSDSQYGEPDFLMYIAMTFQDTGLTAVPEFLVFAELFGLIEVWEKRGPPDMCQKDGDIWVCE
jgi:TolB-like protein